VLAAAIGLVVLSPLLGVIALAIKLNDGGAVFYKQYRVGKHFQLFQLYKFRSMADGTECFGLLTAPEDFRVTRVGHFLRKHKLDELPQLLNVVKGEMQLVGFRPEVECYVQLFPVQYSELLQNVPGITDAASLVYRDEAAIFRFPRGSEQYISEILPDKLRISLEYQRRRNIVSDLKILLRTVFHL
jgi:lipopolysaccharide/colanic/teichoic acid biosynthesis glycosyltransferase